MSRWYQNRKVHSDVPFHWVLTVYCDQSYVSSEIVLACFRGSYLRWSY
uniref:Uncharacterized protein n=1 Tax=Brassica campestris TaxID=3711 RepID=A0A3P6D974_BRACM|nr:unnamed protein product [Brassica rapa]